MRELFIGRLDKRTRAKDLEEIFEAYGKLSRCDVKYGTDTAYAFVDFEKDEDAEDAVRHENGQRLHGASMVVEYARGKPRPSSGYGDDDRYSRRDGFSRGGHQPYYRGRGGFRGGYNGYGSNYDNRPSSNWRDRSRSPIRNQGAYSSRPRSRS